MTTPLTIEDVINGFEHPTITLIHSVQKRLNSNTALVPRTDEEETTETWEPSSRQPATFAAS
jgi:hypothetical protein